MPNETKNYGTVITTAGAALIAKCILNGGKVNIKTAAAGDGGGEYYEPTVAQTALRGKKWEGDVASAAVSTTNANMIDVKITIDDSVGGFTIREMGLFDDAYTKDEVDAKMSSALEYKGSKDTYADLPTTGNKKGDVWNIVNADAAHGVNAGDNVAWNGTTWDVLAGTVDLTAYMLASDLVAISNAELDNICK